MGQVVGEAWRIHEAQAVGLGKRAPVGDLHEGAFLDVLHHGR